MKRIKLDSMLEKDAANKGEREGREIEGRRTVERKI